MPLRNIQRIKLKYLNGNLVQKQKNKQSATKYYTKFKVFNHDTHIFQSSIMNLFIKKNLTVRKKSSTQHKRFRTMITRNKNTIQQVIVLI